MAQLKVNNRRFFCEVIQKHGIFPKDFKNLKFDDSHEEYKKYIFTGECVGGGKCMQSN